MQLKRRFVGKYRTLIGDPAHRGFSAMVYNGAENG